MFVGRTIATLLALALSQQLVWAAYTNQASQQQHSGFSAGNEQQDLSAQLNPQLASADSGAQDGPSNGGQGMEQPAGGSPHGSRIERDGPIFRFNGFALNSTTVKLVWSLKSSAQADYFNIIYGPIPEGTNVYRINRLNGTLRDYTFHNLEADKMYQFQLDGFFNGLLYNKQQLTMVKTPPLSANNQLQQKQELASSNIMPFGVKAEPKSNNSIQLSWTEQERPLGLKHGAKLNIIRYYINPSPLQQQQQLPSDRTTGNNDSLAPLPPQYHYLNITNERASRVLIQKLKPGTEYAFAIKTAYYAPESKKIIAQSMFSMDTTAKTYEIEPSPPRNFTIKIQLPTNLNSSSQATIQREELNNELRLELSWLPPENPNGQLKGYAILYANEIDLPDERWSRIDIKEANINTWYVSNLKPGVSYYFKMRASNQKGLSADSDVRFFVVPLAYSDRMGLSQGNPNYIKLLIYIICSLALISILALLMFKLCCSTSSRRSSKKKNTLNNQKQQQRNILNSSDLNGAKLNGFASTNSASTVAARVGTLARRRENAAVNSNNAKQQDFWINAMEQPDVKSNISEKSNSDVNMAMVSIQRDSPQFATTTQLAPSLPEYRFATGANAAGLQQLPPTDQLMLQQLQQGHYHPGQFAGNPNSFAFDQMDNATASALMTLSKRQQQQMQKYQIQFATTGTVNPMATGNQLMQAGQQGQQAPSPHQQPPPPPPLNIEQQQHHHQQHSLYGTTNNRSLRLHRPAVYDPVSGSFVQNILENGGPPNYNSSHNSSFPNNSNTLQFHPHQSSTLLSRRSTNTLRSFQTAPNQLQQPTYGQLMGVQASNQITFNGQQQPVVSQANNNLVQNHQAVMNQLNNSTYPSLPLKHVSAVRPQIMSSLEDQIEMELAEKEQDQQIHQQDQQQQLNQAQTQPQTPPTIKQ